ncbi:hypothetical protein DB347_25110 [Opitutaceae bacterium EW11]|nr:hypothetical protein DB347_25110 [Opitutaceae bacterium EW11]
MKMKSRNSLLHIGLVLLMATACAFVSCDRPPKTVAKVRKIQILQLGTYPVIDSVVTGFKDRSAELFGGTVQLTILNGNFDSMTLSTLARQMSSSDADLLVSVTTPATGTVVGANRGSKPLVFTFVSNPPSVGFNGPGTLPNTTGLSDVVDYEGTLRMIRNILPQATTIGYLLTRSEENAQVVYNGFQEKAPGFGFRLVVAGIGDERDVRPAAEMLAPKVDLFLLGGDNTVAKAIDTLLMSAKAQTKPVPVFACDIESVKNGAIAAYSVDYKQMGRRTAEICGLILGGADPNRMDVEHFPATALVLNDTSAKIFHVNIPPDLRREAKLIVP